jgi:hypothetical protein
LQVKDGGKTMALTSTFKLPLLRSLRLPVDGNVSPTLVITRQLAGVSFEPPTSLYIETMFLTAKYV